MGVGKVLVCPCHDYQPTHSGKWLLMANPPSLTNFLLQEPSLGKLWWWRHCLSTRARSLSPATGTSVVLKPASQLQQNPSYSEVWHLPPCTCLLHDFQCYMSVRHQPFSLLRDHSNADMQWRALCLHWFFFFFLIDGSGKPFISRLVDGASCYRRMER